MSGPSDCHLGELHAMLRKLVESKPGSRVQAQEEEAEDPMVRRVFWGFYNFILTEHTVLAN